MSRQAIEGSVEQLRQLRERRWEETDLLVLYMDGQRFGSHHVISAVGIDRNGSKHVLGIQVGATENAAAVKQLLTNCAIKACQPIASTCLSSMARKLCELLLTKSSAQSSRCSAAAITR